MDIKNFIEYLTLVIVFPAIVCSGAYLTLKLRFVQIFQLKKSFLYMTRKNSTEEGNISHFGAISSVLAGNFGTGNISGMAVAIATGGPGALVWMWIMAFFGTAIQYVSCVLSISFRRKTSVGEYVGGPMYYLRDGLGYKKLAMLFAVFTIFGSITVGNFAQINSVVLPLEKLGFNPLYCSLLLACIVGVVVLGGIQRIANLASYMVPFKALIYLGVAFAIIALQYDKVLPAFSLMFQHACGFSSFIGGSLGIGVLKAMTTGFDRGLFATDAGTGIVPILQASARAKNPVANGITSLITPVIVMIVCTTTGLVLIVTGAWQVPELYSTNMVTYAFTKGLDSTIGGYIMIIALILFAYTTILAWSYCGEKALGFLIGNDKAFYFRFFYVLLIPMGSFMKVGLIWDLADVAISLMLVTNLIGVVKLSKKVIISSRQFELSNTP